MDVKTLKGIAVVSIASSGKIGTVGDVIIDSQNRRVAAVTVESGGLIRKDKQYLPFESVRSVGSDAVMIEDESVLHNRFGDEAVGYHNLDRVTHIRVVTDSGTLIGHVATVHLDPRNGRITEWEVTQGGIGGIVKSNKLIDSRSIINIGEDIMIVPAAAAGERPEQQSSKQSANRGA